MMTTPPDPRKSVVLRLSADQSSGAHILFPERRITLHGNTDSVIIGRASKSADKGFIASAGNAWFHSPVMSRLHARLSANMDDRKIEIKDLGSLHGTFLNGDQSITGDESVELRQGDVLRFGAPIWRGSEQFFPATVKVDFQFSMA
jgi:pSer/pThr/pTyr-binding forkhead associated (FHA) protein